MASNPSNITNLLPSGDNLALVNPDLFIENERLRSKAAARTQWPWYPAQAPKLAKSQSLICFKRLPPELRMIIWRLARLPRVVEVEEGRTGEFISWTLAPAMMHVCHESRTVGLEVYEEFRGTDEYGQKVSAWINWKEDIVMFKDDLALKAFMNASIKTETESDDEEDVDCGEIEAEDGTFDINQKCCKLAVQSHSFMQFQRKFRVLHHFHELKELILIQKISNTRGCYTGNLQLQDTYTDRKTRGRLLNLQARNNNLRRAIVRDAVRDTARLLEGDEWEEEYERREKERKMNEDLLAAAKIQIEDLAHGAKAENHSQ